MTEDEFYQSLDRLGRPVSPQHEQFLSALDQIAAKKKVKQPAEQAEPSFLSSTADKIRNLYSWGGERLGEIPEGIPLALEKQKVGAEQFGSSLARWAAGELGQEYSPYRQQVEKEAQRLIKESKTTPLMTKAGEYLLMGLESAAIPFSAQSAGGRMGLNALLGAAQAGLQPYESETERLQAAIHGGGMGAFLPEFPGPAMKMTGMAAAPIRGIINPRYGATREVEREMGERGLPTEVGSLYGSQPPFGGEGPTKPPFGSVPGIQPTSGMVTTDPRILELEQNARLRNAPAFMQRDIQNKLAIIEGLRARELSRPEDVKAMEALNKESGALREAAMMAARNQPQEVMTTPLRSAIENIRATPGERGSASAELLAGKTERTGLGVGKEWEGAPDPADLYTARKQIADALAGLTGPNEEITHAAKSARKSAIELRDAIDAGMEAASAGQWSKYLSLYKDKIKPIEEGRAFRSFLEESEKRPTIPGMDVHDITPAQMRRFAEEGTYKEMGKSLVDILSPQNRAFVSDAASALSAMENAQKGARATVGSPTAGYLAGLAKSGLVAGGGPLGATINFLDALGRSRGAHALDEALLDPVKMQSLLDMYHAGKAPSGLGRMLERTSKIVPTSLKTTLRERFR